jgi:RNA polymerase sigma factor (sigma-70 family)
VYNLALHYTQQTEDAQEITQDVFVTVYQSLNTFKGEASVSTWLYRITINKCLDFIKAKKRKKRFGFITSLFFDDSNDVKHDLADSNYHPGIQLEDKEALRTLFSYLNELPGNQKTALILHKIEQKSQIEVADIMDMSPKAIESLVQRAKNNLLKKMKENEGK